MRNQLAFLALAASLAVGSGCSTEPSATDIGVVVDPLDARVYANGSLTFTATVSNDPAGAGVDWTVSGGGTLSGSRAASGVPVTYHAPGSPATVTLTATSVTDPNKSATATVTVFIPIRCRPPQICRP